MNLINSLKLLLEKTKYKIINSFTINILFPELNNFVDLILETDTNIICFKDFWKINNLTNDIINNYLIGSEQININKNKKFIFIILIKNYTKFYYEDNNLNSKNIYIINNFIQYKILNKISLLLYLNNIYFYDNEGDTIMLE
jgi:hypothetical protein